MTREELAQYPAGTVRSTPSLLEAFIQFYKEDTGISPACGGCAFNSNWANFVNSTLSKNNTIKIKNMQTEKNYKVHSHLSNKIFTYYKDGKPFRIYGYAMTDEFAKEYLTQGSEEQLKERIKEFRLIPDETPNNDGKEDAKGSDEGGTDEDTKEEAEKGADETPNNDGKEDASKTTPKRKSTKTTK